METTLTFLGIDVSKKTLDLCLLSPEGTQHLQIANTAVAISRWLKTYARQPEHAPAQLIIALENTGRYDWTLLSVLSQIPCRVFVLSPLHLSRSMGLVRGKTDTIDAERIARFIQKHHMDLRPWQPEPQAVQELKILLAERRSLVKQKRQLRNRATELELLKPGRPRAVSLKLNRQMLSTVKKHLSTVEAEIKAIIDSDDDLNQKSKLIQSIQGVGPVLSAFLLARTQAFTAFASPRQLACYAGVVPFDYRSGTSVRGRSRVSHYADKELKTLLHMAAMRAVRLPGELADYYTRKVAEGKNKMSVLNAVRNKIIHRVFAVLKHNRPYTNYLTLS